MDRLEELQKEREKLHKRLSEIREEELSLEFDDLNLPGKYLYSEVRDLYIHVEDAWITKRPYLGPLEEEEKEIVMSGETLCYGPHHFSWDMVDQISEPFLRGSSGFKSDWKELTEDEWLDAKHKAVESLKKVYS